LREIPGGVKLSARSKSAFDVHALAKLFGGGGHKKASGATIPGQTLTQVRARIVTAALDALAAGARLAAETRGG
jgi:phosphoesterase RecJ-like protein